MFFCVRQEEGYTVCASFGNVKCFECGDVTPDHEQVEENAWVDWIKYTFSTLRNAFINIFILSFSSFVWAVLCELFCAPFICFTSVYICDGKLTQEK